MLTSSNSTMTHAGHIFACLGMLEREHGITAVGYARTLLQADERKYVGRARQGSGDGCRALRLLGWTEYELQALWDSRGDAEMSYVTHYGSVVS